MSTSANFTGPFVAHLLELLPRAQVRISRREEALIFVVIVFDRGNQVRISHEVSILELSVYAGSLTDRAVALARDLAGRLGAALGDGKGGR